MEYLTLKLIIAIFLIVSFYTFVISEYSYRQGKKDQKNKTK